MTVNELISELSALTPELREKDVFVQGFNRELFPPDIRLGLKDRHSPLNHGAENVEHIVLTVG